MQLHQLAALVVVQREPHDHYDDGAADAEQDAENRDEFFDHLQPRVRNLSGLSVQTQPPRCKVAVVFSMGHGRSIAAVCRPIPARAQVTLARVFRHRTRNLSPLLTVPTGT
jgi:hypothetical protein